MEKDRLAEDLEFVKALATEAAAVALERAKRVTPQEKANLSYVTDLDHDLERLIRERLGEAFPDDRLTGEEYAAEGGSGPRRWSIDPIDGTGNLVHGLPLWAISIGLIDGGRAGPGGDRDPSAGRDVTGPSRGGAPGATATRLEAHDADAFHDRTTSASGTNALRAVDPRSLPGRLRDLGSACCEQVVRRRRTGSMACTFLGEATHDVAAGAVIVAEAGCRFGTIDGETPRPPPRWSRRTPGRRTPTFVAPPRRLEALLSRPDAGRSLARARRPVRADRHRASSPRLPESVAELCLVRLGLQCRGLAALALRLRLGSRDRPRRAAEADRDGGGAALLGTVRDRRASHFGVLQYWRSFDELEAWSRRPPHSEWWRAAVERMRTEGRLRHLPRDLPRPPSTGRVDLPRLRADRPGRLRRRSAETRSGPMTTSRGRPADGPGPRSTNPSIEPEGSRPRWATGA